MTNQIRVTSTRRSIVWFLPSGEIASRTFLFSIITLPSSRRLQPPPLSVVVVVRASDGRMEDECDSDPFDEPLGDAFNVSSGFQTTRDSSAVDGASVGERLPRAGLSSASTCGFTVMSWYTNMWGESLSCDISRSSMKVMFISPNLTRWSLEGLKRRLCRHLLLLVSHLWATHARTMHKCLHQWCLRETLLPLNAEELLWSFIIPKALVTCLKSSSFENWNFLVSAWERPYFLGFVQMNTWSPWKSPLWILNHFVAELSGFGLSWINFELRPRMSHLTYLPERRRMGSMSSKRLLAAMTKTFDPCSENMHDVIFAKVILHTCKASSSVTIWRLTLLKREPGTLLAFVHMLVFLCEHRAVYDTIDRESNSSKKISDGSNRLALSNKSLMHFLWALISSLLPLKPAFSTDLTFSDVHSQHFRAFNVEKVQARLRANGFSDQGFSGALRYFKASILSCQRAYRWTVK